MSQTAKPNLLFISTDQQRYDTLRCYGNERIQTPTLNALADESFVFQNAYVAQPICTPARASIMTGLYPHTNGCIHLNIPLQPGTATIAEMISSEYKCGHIGKWHLGDEIFPQHSFSYWVGMEDHYRLFYIRREYLSAFSEYHDFLIQEGYEPDVEWGGARVFSRQMTADLPGELTKNAFLGSEAARFIRDNHEQPFVLYVGFMDPHSPLPSRPITIYNPDELPREPHFLRKPPDNASIFHRMMAEHFLSMRSYKGESLEGAEGWLRYRARYWEAISMVDQAMATIFEALAESGVSDTFTSDHGEMLGSHGMLHKTVHYQESIKVPLLMRVPWLTKELTRIEGHMSQIDLVPTLLDLMGETVPANLEGRSLVPALGGQASLGENAVFIETNGPIPEPIARPRNAAPWPSWQPWRTLISGDGSKLNLSPVDQCELYDLNSDPTEKKNLFDEPKQDERLHEMTARLRRWQDETGDDEPLPNV